MTTGADKANNVTRNTIITLLAISLILAGHDIFAAEDSDHHLPHNHIALVAAAAFEEQADGHRESGNVLGLEYIRQVTEHWGWGAAIEREVFGDNHDRIGILVVPVSYFPNDRWRLVAGPGVEFRERGERDHAVFRIGAGYEFELGEHFTLSPEAVIDFVAGGTTVYVLGFSLGYGF
jgi:hypothetical protein